MPPISGPLDIIKSVRMPLAGIDILDIGCGEGALVKLLTEEGAHAVGIDPGSKAIAAARARVARATFVMGTAAKLPYQADTFDLTVVVNALHHVPRDLMVKALREALRVLRKAGALVVIEPLADGNFFAALRLIEDETEVRHLAQAAIGELVSGGEATLVRTLTYVRHETFADVASFVARVVAVDPGRQAVVDNRKDDVSASILASALHDEMGQLVFDQPIKADILRPRRT